MKKEYLDVLDENGQKTGQIKLRSEVHLDGDWHASIHVWILNSQGELLLQLRAPQLLSNPNKWDISFAGHVSAGNTAADEVFREGKEELGLDLDKKEVKYLFTVKQKSIRDYQKNLEINEVYLIEKDLDLDKLTLQTEELAAVKFMPWREFKDITDQKNPEYCWHPEEYNKLFEYLEKINK